MKTALLASYEKDEDLKRFGNPLFAYSRELENKKRGCG